jgi:hypothetical protein
MWLPRLWARDPSSGHLELAGAYSSRVAAKRCSDTQICQAAALGQPSSPPRSCRHSGRCGRIPVPASGIDRARRSNRPRGAPDVDERHEALCTGPYTGAEQRPRRAGHERDQPLIRPLLARSAADGVKHADRISWRAACTRAHPVTKPAYLAGSGRTRVAATGGSCSTSKRSSGVARPRVLDTNESWPPTGISRRRTPREAAFPELSGCRRLLDAGSPCAAASALLLDTAPCRWSSQL